MGEVDRRQDLLGHRTPWIGLDGLRQSTPVGKGAPLDSGEDSLERPGLHWVIGRRSDVAELEGGSHRTISTATDRQTPVTFFQSVQRASSPLYWRSCLMVRASAGRGSASCRASWVATPCASGP